MFGCCYFWFNSVFMLFELYLLFAYGCVFFTDLAIRLCKQVHGLFEGLLHHTSDQRGGVRVHGQVQPEHLQAGKRVEEFCAGEWDLEGRRAGVCSLWDHWNRSEERRVGKECRL